MNSSVKALFDGLKHVAESQAEVLSGGETVGAVFLAQLLDERSEQGVEDWSEAVEALDEEYLAADKAGRGAESMSIKRQMCLAGGIRRDMKLRLISPVRAIIHESARRRSHGESGGTIDTLGIGQIEYMDRLAGEPK